MGSFQDEIQQIRQEREAQIKIDACDMERRRQECEPYIEHICNSIRCGIKREAVNGDVAYRVYRKYSIGDDDEADELLDERQEEPHYVIIWTAQCMLDVTKNYKVSLLDLDACHELEKAFEKSKTGIGGNPSFEVIGSRFAYFIPESGEKGNESL